MEKQKGPRYKVMEPLGRGAFGAVFLARDNVLDRNVALKVMSVPEGLDSDEEQHLLDRFEREARAAASLSHPNIVIIYDISRTKDKHFISMEYLEGETLSEVVTGPMPVDRAVNIAQQVLSALSYAHEHGVIHRDIKPDNIFIMPDDYAKLVDFGLARVQATSSLTQTGTVLGSPGYIAPEIFEGRKADERTDIFSFGVVFYQMLCGKRPFGPDDESDSNYANVMFKVISAEPDPPSELCPEIPPELERIVLGCLRKKPEERYQTVEEVQKELDDFESRAVRGEPDARQQELAARRKALLSLHDELYGPREGMDSTQADAQPAAFLPPAAPTGRWKPTRTVLAVVIACLLVLGAGSTFLLVRILGANRIMASVDSLELKRKDGEDLDLQEVPLDVDLVLEISVRCHFPKGNGQGQLTANIVGGDQQVQMSKTFEVTSNVRRQVIDYEFHMLWSTGEDFKAEAALDVSTTTKDSKSSGDLQFYVPAGLGSSISFDDAKQAAASTLDDAEAAMQDCQDNGIDVSDLEPDLAGARTDLETVESVDDASTVFEFALNLIDQFNARLKNAGKTWKPVSIPG